MDINNPIEADGLTRRQILATSGAAVAASAAGCLGDDDDDDAGGVDPDADFELRYIPHGSGATDPFWETQEIGWNTAVDQLGVESAYQGPREEDFVQQVNNIESAIDAGIDGLAVTIPDPDMFRDTIERAQDQGIRVVVTNVTDDSYDLPYIGQPEEIVGEELAQRVVPLFEETTGSLPDEAVIANHSPGHSALELRQGGIEDVLDDHGVDHDWIEVPEGDDAGVISSINSHTQANPDVELIFSLGPTGGDPIVDWIEDEGLDGEMYHAGVDISATLAEAIDAGFNLGQVIQQPWLQGYLAAHYLWSHLAVGILAPTTTPTGPTFVSAANLDAVRMQIDEVGVA